LKRIAFLFPGQNSQKVGMGQDLYDAYDQAKDIFSQAESVSGLPITRLCFEGPMEDLTETVNLQPAITAVNLTCLAAVEAAGIRPALCAGHSLGEYGALRASGVISDADCLKLVYDRGRLMHREATANKGAMSAIIGLDITQVDQIVSQAAAGGGVVAVANHNSAEQIVITGEPDAVAAAGAIAANRGARAIALKVSGAWHSPLIKGAEAEFRACLERIDFHPPRYPTLHNVTAATEENIDEIKALMARQLCSPVRWYDTMLKMMEARMEVYVEIGPGKVLTGLMKKILPKGDPVEIYNVSDLPSLEAFIAAMK
jgi:[acyl-carrier-protein] S-malonyltransferase